MMQKPKETTRLIRNRLSQLIITIKYNSSMYAKSMAELQ